MEAFPKELFETVKTRIVSGDEETVFYTLLLKKATELAKSFSSVS